MAGRFFLTNIGMFKTVSVASRSFVVQEKAQVGVDDGNLATRELVFFNIGRLGNATTEQGGAVVAMGPDEDEPWVLVLPSPDRTV